MKTWGLPGRALNTVISVLWVCCPREKRMFLSGLDLGGNHGMVKLNYRTPTKTLLVGVICLIHAPVSFSLSPLPPSLFLLSHSLFIIHTLPSLVLWAVVYLFFFSFLFSFFLSLFFSPRNCKLKSSSRTPARSRRGSTKPSATTSWRPPRRVSIRESSSAWRMSRLASWPS